MDTKTAPWGDDAPTDDMMRARGHEPPSEHPDPGHVWPLGTFETSSTTAHLDDALAKAQGEVQAAKKDSANPHFRSKYADLASVWDACREALSKHGVNVTQWPVQSDDGRLHLVTRLACKGEWMRALYAIPCGKNDAHGHGSAITYARRYTLAAAVGVAPDEDDDGNAASGGDRKPPKQSSEAAAKIDKLRGAVKLKYEQCGGKEWMSWSNVVAGAGAKDDRSFDGLRTINDWLKDVLAQGKKGAPDAA